MRKALTLILIALVASSTALAGCFGKDDEAADDTTPPGNDTGDDGTTPPDDGDAGDGGAGDGDDNATEPPEEPKPADFSTSVQLDGSPGIAGVQDSMAEGSFTVTDGGWMTFTINVTANSFNANAVDIKVFDAAGTEVGGTTMTANAADPATPPEPVSFDVSATEPGDFTITATAQTASAGFSLTADVSVTY